MTPDDIERLRGCVDKEITMHTVDGETLTARVVLMQDEDNDFIYELIHSNKESKYTQPLGSCCYVTRYDEVVSFEVVEERE